MLSTNDLSIHETYETPNFEVREIALQCNTNKWNVQVSDTMSGSQSLLLLFREFIMASKVVEARKDGFFYDAQEIQA
jgi:hypothetical protein